MLISRSGIVLLLAVVALVIYVILSPVGLNLSRNWWMPQMPLSELRYGIIRHRVESVNWSGDEITVRFDNGIERLVRAFDPESAAGAELLALLEKSGTNVVISESGPEALIVFLTFVLPIALLLVFWFLFVRLGQTNAESRTSSMRRANISGHSPYESSVGFSRAVRVGNVVVVSGTAPIGDDGRAAFPGDPYNQTLVCLDIIKKALERAGLSLRDVIRTRIYISDLSDYGPVCRAHAEVFGDIKPASTMIVVKLLEPEWHVEIEAEAVATTGNEQGPSP